VWSVSGRAGVCVGLACQCLLYLSSFNSYYIKCAKGKSRGILIVALKVQRWEEGRPKITCYAHKITIDFLKELIYNIITIWH
jgi:hypothetical protein